MCEITFTQKVSQNMTDFIVKKLPYDFDAIEKFRGDDFFTRALDVDTVPSSSTSRCGRLHPQRQ